MEFKELSSYLEKLDKISSRLEITRILSDLFKKLSPLEIDKASYLLLGSLAPKFRSIVFNIADQMVIRAISQAYGVDSVKVKEAYKLKGDLGEVASSFAEQSKLEIKNSHLSILEVYHQLLLIAEDEGDKSQERKVEGISNLLKDIDSISVKFVIRILIGKLRLGFSDKTILDALSWMQEGDKSKKKFLEMAYNVLPDVGLLAKEVKKVGIEKAAFNVIPHIGIPVSPMLTQRVKSPAEMITKMGEVFVEPKFDGLRVQIHIKKGKEQKIGAFTRNMNDVSWMFPELVELVSLINADEVILDAEGIGVDESRKALFDFQTTMTRRRKHDIAKIATEIGMKFYIFDVMYIDGKSYMNTPYEQRKERLKALITPSKTVELVESTRTKDPEVIRQKMKDYRAQGLEGAMIKKVDALYVSGRTGYRWVKMKEDETSHAKLADTLDCIVMGYSVGKGKRADFGVGQFLVGVLDKGFIKTVTKVGTGISDQQFGELKKRLKKLEVKKKPQEYDIPKLLIPDYWVYPSLVVEIAGDEITQSPNHTSGYALRFPKLIKFRDDKSVSDATTLGEVKKLYEFQ